MNEIVVPEGMRKAVMNVRSDYMTRMNVGCEATIPIILKAALHWLDAELEKMKNNDPISDYDSAIEEVRRLFIEPEGEFCPTCGLRQDTRVGIHKEEIVP